MLTDFPEWDENCPEPQPINSFGALKLVDNNEKLPLIEWCIVCEYIHDVIQVFSTDPNFTAEHIINLPLTFDHKFLAMECIFSSLLQLPDSSFGNVYYARIIIELFSRQPKLWPKAVGRCLLHLFENMDKLDFELRERLADWFSFHLTNFGNNWPWDKWSFVVNLPADSPKRQFSVKFYVNKWNWVIGIVYVVRYQQIFPMLCLILLNPK
eukprot:UN23129